ncbi:MAG: hypothetical protein OFPI_05120 [Osedax symbiont Rs2]|nr:MAG: hypothetical protein OFPI_05120 [Osedax symbiont Rs2]
MFDSCSLLLPIALLFFALQPNQCVIAVDQNSSKIPFAPREV